MRALAALGIAFSLGPFTCKKKPPPEPPPVSVTPVSSSAPSPSVSAPAMPTAGPPGFAYVKAKQLVAIDPSGKVSVIKTTGYLQSVVRASDGKAYALLTSGGSTSIALLEGEKLAVVAKVKDCSSSIDGSFDARGERMVLSCGKDGVSMRESAAAPWVLSPRPSPDDYERRAWLSAKGTLWYGSNKGLFERKGGTWSAVEAKTTTFGKPKAFFDAPEGIDIVEASTLYHVENGKSEVVRTVKGSTSFLQPASNGLFAFWSRDTKEASFQTRAGEVKKQKTKAWLSKGILDDSGRAWSLLDGQIEIAKPDGEDAIRIPMGSYAEFDHLTIISELVVLGSGPAIPPSKPVRKTKKMTGKITVNGKPLANAPIEICPRADWTFGGSTPCSGADESVLLKGTTDERGAFSFDDVPVGTWYMHYKPADGAKWTVDGTELEVREGKVTNLGTLAYGKK